MKKFLKAAGLSAAYFFIYFAFQFLFIFIITIIHSLIKSQQGSEITAELVMSLMYENLSLTLALSILASLGIYFIIFRVKRRRIIREISFKSLDFKSIFYLLLLSLSTSVLISLLVSALISFFPSYNEVTESINYTTESIFGVITTTLMVPFFEEVLFRGLIYREFKKIMPFIPALIIQGIIFGAAHGNMLQFIYAFLLGLILGFVYHQFKSLWAPILVHCSFNLLGSVILPNYLYTNEVLLFVYILFGILVTVFCLHKILSLGASERSSITEENFDVENSI